MNVNVIENYKQPHYEEIKQEYMDELISVEDIKQKYDLGQGRWKSIRKQIFEETGYKRTSHNRKKRKVRRFNNVYMTRNGSWQVTHVKDGKTSYFGTYKDRNDALEVATFLRDNNWDFNKLPSELKCKRSKGNIRLKVEQYG